MLQTVLDCDSVKLTVDDISCVLYWTSFEDTNTYIYCMM